MSIVRVMYVNNLGFLKFPKHFHIYVNNYPSIIREKEPF